jgi:acyl-CoA thioesterase-1
MSNSSEDSVKRIVAFGDSLTTGFQSPSEDNPGGEATPYGEFLQEMLRDQAAVIVRGVNGELTDDLLMRLGRDVLARDPDVVVVLGGANDLGWGAKPELILRNLSTIYEKIRAKGALPVAVTVPSMLGMDSMIPGRRALNKLIADHCRENDIPCVDLFTATSEPDTGRLAARYSNDGLHLSTEGYKLLAKLVYEIL